jgi:transcriptional regulator with XRE-family HTH domain
MEIDEDEAKLRKILSANLKKYRAQAGLSQEKLAEAAGLSTQMVNDIEGCRRWLSGKSLARVASILGVEAFQLLLPHTEAERLHPVRLPADALAALKSRLRRRILADLDRAFDTMVKFF